MLSLLLMAASTPSTPQLLAQPPALVAALGGAERLYRSPCAGMASTAGAAVDDPRAQRYLTQRADVVAIWGGASVPDTFDAADPATCRDGDTGQAFDDALDEVDRAFADATVPLTRGVWVGALPLCRQTVVLAELTTDSTSDEPVVSITLTPEAGALFANLTRATVGQRIAMRYNGGIMVQPTVNEPILGGQLQITRGYEPDLEPVVAAIAADC